MTKSIFALLYIFDSCVIKNNTVNNKLEVRIVFLDWDLEKVRDWLVSRFKIMSCSIQLLYLYMISLNKIYDIKKIKICPYFELSK